MAATFTRRRGNSEDEIQLVDAEVTEEDELGPQDTPLTNQVAGINANDVVSRQRGVPDIPSSIDEEEHNVPFPLTLKQRVRQLKMKRSRQIYWWITVTVLGILCILAMSIPLGLWSNLPKESCLDFEDVPEEEYEEFPYLYFPRTGEIDLCHKGETMLKGRIGVNHELVDIQKVDLYDYTHDTKLKLSRPGDNYKCLRVEWTGTSSIDAPLKDCYKFGDSFWYAGYESYNQMWPINDKSHPMGQFVPNDYLSDSVSHPEWFGSVVHPIWLSSNGSGILVDEGVPLYVSVEKNDEICIQALPYELECIPHSLNQTILKYTLCVYENIRETAKHFLGKINSPTSQPDKAIFRDPIWSTWAQFKTDITYAKLKGFYDDIIGHGFNISQLEIDDGYSTEYGELSFNEDFSKDDIKALSKNVSLTAWVHPFVSPHAEEFMMNLEGVGHYLPGVGNSVSLVKWWHNHSAVINIFSESIAEEHKRQLEDFQRNYNLTSFKFDAGEMTYLPECVLISTVENPATFASVYARFVANQSYASRAEVRVGYFTQDLPILVRILDRDSSWTTNGLQTVIPTVLSLSIAGYRYILPDMIGGNGLAADISSKSTPPEELYLRWVQLNTFLPVMQFSFVPWNYSKEVVDHVRVMTELHRSLADLFDGEGDSSPIIKPLWWVSDNLDDEPDYFWTKYVNEEFVIGNGNKRLLIAPVLEEAQSASIDIKCNSGETLRSVYFPHGNAWKVKRPLTEEGDTHAGGSMHNFCVDFLDTLYFEISH